MLYNKQQKEEYKQTYRQLYRQGLTLRQIGVMYGKDFTVIRYHLRRFRDYKGLVTQVLHKRILLAYKQYHVAPARDNLRKLKLAVFTFKRERPELFRAMVDHCSPSRCNQCGMSVKARRLADLWAWRCEACGASGIEAGTLLNCGIAPKDEKP